MTRIGIIHNPFAKGNLKRPWVAGKIREALGDVGTLRETRNIGELSVVAEEFKKEGIDIIGVNGGDGSLHLVLTAFIKAYGDQPIPKLMSLRGGSMNTMSNSLKIKGHTIGIVKKAVDNIKKGKPFSEKPQHLLCVNGMYGFMSGAGTISTFLDTYYGGTSTGPWRAIQTLSNTIYSAIVMNDYGKRLRGTRPARITIDGRTLEQDRYSVMLACVIAELGLGFTPTPHAYDKPGHFHFLATDIDPVKIIPMLPRIWMGKDLIHPQMRFTQAAADVVIDPLGEPMRWMIDGEMMGSNEPLHYTCGPTITVVQPYT